MVNRHRKVCAACAHWEAESSGGQIFCDTVGACALARKNAGAGRERPNSKIEACGCCESYSPKA